jgi:tetratricopeptide (TPR) repeat protein
MLSTPTPSLDCGQCREPNPAAAKYCLACGARLRLSCAQCGTEIPPHARFCIECGSPTVPPGSPLAGDLPSAHPPEALEPTAAAAPPPRVVVERASVLNALYQQGVDALRRGDGAAAAAALTPVVEEAADVYPDAQQSLANARRGRAPRAAMLLVTRHRPPTPASAENVSPVEARRATGLAASDPRPAPAQVRGWASSQARRPLTAVAGSLPPLRAGLRELARSTGAWTTDSVWRGLRPHRARLDPLLGRGGWPVLGLGLVTVVLLLGGLFLLRRDPGALGTTAAQATAAVPTAEPDDVLFTRCDAEVAASRWAEAISTCRILRARDPDYPGLTERLVAAYLGRGQQHLTSGNRFEAAEDDFQQALAYQPDAADAQRAWQQLQLYREADKALVHGDWPQAVSQFGALHAQAPDYLHDAPERSVEGKMFTAWLRWGQSALNAGDLPTAAQRCGQAAALVPNDPEARICVEAASA